MLAAQGLPLRFGMCMDGPKGPERARENPARSETFHLAGDFLIAQAAFTFAVATAAPILAKEAGIPGGSDEPGRYEMQRRRSRAVVRVVGPALLILIFPMNPSVGGYATAKPRIVGRRLPACNLVSLPR